MFRSALERALSEMGIQAGGEQLRLCEEYLALMIETNKTMNLTRITDPEEAAVKHFADSLSALKWLNGANDCADIGTGAGFPGVPLAIFLPDTRFTLFDSSGKKADFVNNSAQSLALKNVYAVHMRAEDAAKKAEYREKYGAVLARAVAPLRVLCEYCLPMAKTGGIMIAFKSEAAQELKGARTAVRTLGGGSARVEPAGVPGLEHSLVIIEKTGSTPREYPRKAGTPEKNPL